MAGIVIEPEANEALEPGSGQPMSDPFPDWIVCRGAERQVAAGRVLCPGSTAGEWVAVETCLACRHLIATPWDRLPEAWCATG